MTIKRHLVFGSVWVALLGVLWFGQSALERVQAQNGGTVQAPKFEVDPMWPKPMPNHWILGSAIGVSVDSRDHIWIIHRGAATLDDNEKAMETRPPASKNCCRAAPPVLEFDQDGNVVSSWGGPGPGYEWPESNHGITVESNGTVWIAGNGGNDGQVLKFTREGKFIKQFGFGYANSGSTDTFAFRQPAKIFVDETNKEVYIADGYGNHRVIVLNSDTGAFKRLWGAYGNPPDDVNYGRYNPGAPPLQQFRNPVHCAELSKDRMLYVCDRVNDRIQVFTPEGKFLKEQFIEKETLGSGSTWDITFSRDAVQKYIFLVDGMNQRIHVIDRPSLQEVTSFGDGGRQPGQFFGVHSIASDSKGNLYTTETWEGKRIQKFTYKGLGGVTATPQGTVWPRATTSR